MVNVIHKNGFKINIFKIMSLPQKLICRSSIQGMGYLFPYVSEAPYDYLYRLVQERGNSIANALELLALTHRSAFTLQNHVDSKSASAMFDLLRKKLHYTAGYPHLLSMLFHLLQLPCKYWSRTQMLQHFISSRHLELLMSDERKCAW